MKLLENILFFAFPACCDVCGGLLAETEKIICTNCLFRLPRTNFHLDNSNPVSMLFWGRVPVSMASSWFYFYKGSPYQSLLHKLKYKGIKEIGRILGRFYASEIQDTKFSTVEIIIPVPLHPKKEKKRGYNQSEIIALGINDIFCTELDTESLVRRTETDTQTRKNRFERFLNMEDKFIVQRPEKLRGRSILLVDDVVTTGSTLESCAIALLNAGCSEIMVITLAVA